MASTILSLATAEPVHSMLQEEIAENMIDFLNIKGLTASKIRKLYQHSAIKKRHSVRPFDDALFTRLKAPPKPTFLSIP